MANTANTDRFFNDKVKPVMDRVYSDMQHRMADEMKKEMTSMRTLMASAAGPDGMVTGNLIAIDTARTLGEWNSKTVDDYLNMVKASLRKNNIKVNAVIEKKMISYIIDQQVPKSAGEYIMSKTAKGSIFVLPELTHRTPTQNYIDAEAEKRYAPSLLEDATAGILSWATNAGATMGIGGFWGQTATDMAISSMDYATGSPQKYLDTQKAKAEKEVREAEKRSVVIPKWMLTQNGFEKISSASDAQLASSLKWAAANAKWYRSKVQTALDNGTRTFETGQKTPENSVTGGILRARQYEMFANAIKNEQETRKIARETEAQERQNESADNQHSDISEEKTPDLPQATDTSQNSVTASDTQSGGETDYSGWNNLLGGMGLGGIGDTANHLGFTLASLPDMLIGILTGRTKSIGMNLGTMMPLAAIIAGTFIKNPLLKLPMMLWGGASLFNKMGQESLANHRYCGITAGQTSYKRYSDELLDPRITNPVIEGDKLILNIDNAPRIVNLTPQMVEAYRQGALPLNTLANRVLAKSDQMQQTVTETQANEVSRRYEQSQQQEQTRGIR